MSEVTENKKHSKGPWKKYLFSTTILSADDKIVAVCKYDEHDESSVDEAVANCFLIAQAPQLLAENEALAHIHGLNSMNQFHYAISSKDSIKQVTDKIEQLLNNKP